MKHIITGILLTLAIAAGLFLPEAFMNWQDQVMETPELVPVTEPTLQWNPSKAQTAREEIDGEEIARRLMLFQSGPQVNVPIGNYAKDDVLWATERAMDFLNMVLEVEPQIFNSGSEYQLAWFEDGTTIAFWTTYVNFHGDCAFIVNIDAESGAILQCFINPNLIDLSELFPESFTRAAEEPDTDFEALVAQQFCDALCFFMGYDEEEGFVWTTAEPNAININFPDTSVTVMLYVDYLEGIRFNVP